MLYSEQCTVLIIQNSSSFWACLFSKHACFRKIANCRATTVYRTCFYSLSHLHLNYPVEKIRHDQMFRTEKKGGAIIHWQIAKSPFKSNSSKHSRSLTEFACLGRVFRPESGIKYTKKINELHIS